jgi:sugar/nucleoside kinase (ribokinase family)
MKKLNKDFRVVLGLNESEALRVAGVLGVKTPRSLSHKELADEMYKLLDVHCLVVHPVKCAFAASPEGYFYTDGVFCENPVLTTGAGDNFNAGFCLGLLCGLGMEDALRAGVGNSGFYVRNGRSADLHELIGFMKGLVEDKHE